MQALVGPRHPGVKLAAGLVALLVLVFGLWQTDHRVSARTVIEGSTQIARVAPFDGFIAQGLVRAGDTVKRGQEIALETAKPGVPVGDIDIAVPGELQERAQGGEPQVAAAHRVVPPQRGSNAAGATLPLHPPFAKQH